jgi:hypothetical protein
MLTAVLGIAAGMVHPVSAADLSKALTLNGQIESEAGAPVPNAHVFIYTAGPRVGTSPI